MVTPRLRPTIYTGTFIHCPSLDTLEVLEDGAVGVDEDGTIVFVENGLPRGMIEERARHWGWGDIGMGWDLVSHVVDGKGWWFPGFVGRPISLLSSMPLEESVL